MLKRQWMLWPVALGLTACISLGPSKGSPVHDYQLVNGTVRIPVLTPKACTVSVQEGWVETAYHGTAMAYQTQPYQVNYFALNRWRVPPLTMMIGDLAQALQGSRGFKAVIVRPPYIGHVDRVVHINLLELSQVFDATGTVAKQHLQLQLVITNDFAQTVVSQKTFTAEVPVQTTPFGGVQGANQAWQQVLPGMVAYIYHECA